MKIALISYHNEPNYGTMLQAYALVYALKRIGFDSEYINYVGINQPSKIKLIVRRILLSLGLLKRTGEFAFWDSQEFKPIYIKFQNFHKTFIPSSKEIYYKDTIINANYLYQLFMVGSDQTWSPYLNIKDTYFNFLTFVNDRRKKTAYAPSFGTTNLPNSYLSKVAKEISTFSFASCRERTNSELLSNMLNRQIPCVLDPTLLLTSDEWNLIASCTHLKRKSYILAYILGERNCVSDYAEALGREKKLPVYYIATRPYYLSKDNIIKDAGPNEFLSLIRDAAYVVTDSFHGSIFSINFKTNFYSFTKREQNATLGNDNARIMEILSEFDLCNRFKNNGDYSFEADIDFEKVHSRLTDLRKHSIAFLNDILY